MDEHIVTVCRAAACWTRLRILRCLLDEGEMPPKDLAEAMGISRGTTVNHLRRLLQAELISRDSHEARKWYSAKTTDFSTPLHDALTTWILKQLRTKEKPKSTAQATALFRTLTILANERRVAIFRALSTQAMDLPTLVMETELPRDGVEYHVRKLQKRGVIVVGGKQGRPSYHLRSSADPGLKGLMNAIEEHWPPAPQAEHLL
jgi:DNA-binding transcriptional ArsR family regulator